eukprot:CAMPEP_0197661620 /NCGR_PEP_ID=MMETSP1338-20131121/51560_1 /TAXON_ID=43686 ORGANISM="Pelagodinium beii, Strain RCC1491" /NCGR_SAMPLE_ID=MMETSP1338 /ASSEMBLY_ACC=CAM_ASM_000754 /LENGTH=192 /DNA_ID=CAMNT_0043239199 /DNA_START=58 /DNA_END=633 /DNA_ORIENTATION=-
MGSTVIIAVMLALGSAREAAKSGLAANQSAQLSLRGSTSLRQDVWLLRDAVHWMPACVLRTFAATDARRACVGKAAPIGATQPVTQQAMTKAHAANPSKNGMGPVGNTGSAGLIRITIPRKRRAKATAIISQRDRLQGGHVAEMVLERSDGAKNAEKMKTAKLSAANISPATDEEEPYSRVACVQLACMVRW